MTTHCLPYASLGTPPARATETCLLGDNYSIGIHRCLHKRCMCFAIGCRFLCRAHVDRRCPNKEEVVQHAGDCRTSGSAEPCVMPEDTAFTSSGSLGFRNEVISLGVEVGGRNKLRDHGPSAQRQPLPPERHRCSQNRQGCLGCRLVPRAAPETAPGHWAGPASPRPNENPQSWLIERRRVRGARVRVASFFPSRSDLSGTRKHAQADARPFGSMPARGVQDGRPALHVRRRRSILFQSGKGAGCCTEAMLGAAPGMAMLLGGSQEARGREGAEQRLLGWSGGRPW